MAKKKKEEKPHYNIIYCLPGKKYPDGFHSIWLDSAKAGYKCACVHPPYNANVYYARTMCLGNNGINSADIHRPLFENKITYDYIVWIDDDCIVNFQHIYRLLKQDVDIVSGLYHMQCKDKFPVVEKENWEYYEKHGSFEFLTDQDVQAYQHLVTKNNEKETDKKKFTDINGYNIGCSLLPVFYTGFGCMVIKKGVFEKIGYPYFAPEFFTLSNGVSDFYSEDSSFCVKAKKAGYQVYVDIGVIIGHEKNYIV